jgi:HPt (histidine-containing phosphotransfer) domain-containing protein
LAHDDDSKHQVIVPREFQELVPAFLENRRSDAHALRVLLQSDDLEGLRLLGDRIKGVAGSYGFARLAAIAKLIEDNAKRGNRKALDLLVAQYDEHLGQLRLQFE